MSNDPVGRRPRSTGLYSTLRIAALAAVALGVVLLAAAAFVLSYEGIHHIALHAGVSPRLAKLYPLIFDVMLVVAGAAALALRGAGWWARCYAWGSLLILLAAMAVGNALYATGTTLPAEPTKAIVAVVPWVLLLMAFGLLLELLRHFRTTRPSTATTPAGAAAPGAAAPGAAAAGAAAAGAAAAGAAVGADANGGPRMAAAQAAAGGKMREHPRVDLDTLLGPKAGEPPAIDVLYSIGAGQNDRHQIDPVSYGEDTGYVHPDSYLDEGEYSPHGDTGGPGSPDESASNATAGDSDVARHGAAPAEVPAAAAGVPAAAAGAAAAAHPATSAESQATSETARTTAAEPSATPAGAPATSAEPPATAPGIPATAATESPATIEATAPEPLFAPAPAAPTAAGTPATPAATTPAAAEPMFTPAPAPATATESPATAAETPTTAAETPAPAAGTPASAAETPAAPPAATAAPAGAAAGEAATSPGNGSAADGGPAGEAATGPGNGSAADGGPAGEAATGTKNGLAADGVPAGAETPTGEQELVGAEGPALERIRSTPTRPEE